MTSAGIAQQKVSTDLVGSYFYSFEWGGSRLTLRANGSFIKETSSCTSVSTQSGRYDHSEQVLRLTPVKLTIRDFGSGKEFDLRKPKARKRFLDTDEPFRSEQYDLRIVKWGERTYLMDEGRFKSFIEAINLGFEPRQVERYRPFFGEILLREGDEDKDVTGDPPLPAEFISLILREPITATVIRIETIDGNKIATLDRGTEDGLREHMTLVPALDNDAFSFRSYWILSLEERTATVQVMDDVKVGDKLTTRVKDVSRYARLHLGIDKTPIDAD